MTPDPLHLIEQFKAGDLSSFEGLVRVYQDRIYNLCRHLLGHPQNAEDAAQETFLKAYRNLKRFTPEASFYTWLYRIAVNTCLDFRKRPFFESLFKRSAEGEESMAVEPVDERSPERLYESRQTGHIVQRSLQAMSPKLRVVLVLKEMEGLSYQEIAELLKISLGTVKSRMARARGALQTLLKKNMEQK